MLFRIMIAMLKNLKRGPKTLKVRSGCGVPIKNVLGLFKSQTVGFYGYRVVNQIKCGS